MIIFVESSNVYGWGIWEMMFFLGTAFIIDSLHMIFFYFNIVDIPRTVRTGELDLILLKPASSKFLLSLKRLNFSSVASLMFGIVMVIASYYNLNTNASFLIILLYLGFICNGVMIMYSILFSCAILSIHFLKTEGLIEVFFEIFQFGMKPEMIYGYGLRMIITYIIPVIVIVNFPVILIIEGFSLRNFLWGFMITILMILGSSMLWKNSLKKYTSASS